MDEELVEKVAEAIRLDDGSPCISMVRRRCKHQDGCVCRSLAGAAIQAVAEHGQAAASSLLTSPESLQKLRELFLPLLPPNADESLATALAVYALTGSLPQRV